VVDLLARGRRPSPGDHFLFFPFFFYFFFSFFFFFFFFFFFRMNASGLTARRLTGSG